MLCQILTTLCQIEMFGVCVYYLRVWACICECSLACSLKSSSCICPPEPVLWMTVRHGQTPGGNRIQLEGWKHISNQVNLCQNIDRLMGAVMDLMSFCRFYHAIVIYVVQPYHLIAILHYYFFVRWSDSTDCLFILESKDQLAWTNSCPFMLLDWIKCVSGGKGQGGNSAVAAIIFSLKSYSLYSCMRQTWAAGRVTHG